MSEDLLKAKSYAEELLEDTKKVVNCKEIAQYLYSCNTDPTYDMCNNFFRVYLRVYSWVGTLIYNDNMKRYIRDDLNWMLDAYTNSVKG